MNSQRFPFRLGLSLVVGSSLLILGTPGSAEAQHRMSDVTGPSITTGNGIGRISDVTGGLLTSSGVFVPGVNGRTRFAYRSNGVESAVNQAAQELNALLAAGTLSAVGTAGSTTSLSATSLSATAISAAVQQALGTLLTGTGDVDASASQLEQGLVANCGGITPQLAQNLTSRLRRLTANSNVNPTQLVQAVEAFNNVINTSDNACVISPPQELVAVQSVLTRLLNAGFAAV